MTRSSRKKRGPLRRAVFLFLFFISFSLPGQAAKKVYPQLPPPPEPTPAKVADKPAPLVYSTPHANIFGLSIAYQAPLTLDKSPPLGGGLTYTHEYFVSRRTALGVHTGVRFFPAQPWHLAIGYGLTFKHYITSLKPSGPSTGLYLLYGLLLQMNFLEGRKGSATGHDTRLAVGYDWQTGPVFPTFEVGYHLTQVRSFDEDTLWWSYTEVVGGIRF